MPQSILDADNRYKSFELPGARPHYTPDRPGQVEHIALVLHLDLTNQAYHGTCTIRLNPVRSGVTRLTLDAIQLQIDSVNVAGMAQRFDYDGEQVHIDLAQPTVVGQKIEVAIAYGVQQPQRGLYFIQPDGYYPHKPVQVWTQGEDEDSRFWFPCFDYPGQLATSEIRVTVPKPFMAISNGELVQIEELGDQRVFHWFQKEVHPTYLMTLAVGDFAELRDEWRGKPMTYYVEKGREAQAKISMGKTPRMVELFSQLFGYPYAFPKYAQVCVDDFIFGGMENTSTTLLTDRCLLDERAAIDNLSTETLVAHELAHQWFGDLVVIKHWSHAWIKEGMASYSEIVWIDEEYGADAAAYYRLGEARSYLDEDSSRYRRPIVTHVYREAIELYDRHLYEKGACVYHMIRAELGDELFWRAIATFVQDHAHQTVETVDLLRSIEKASGRNLLFLFDQYVYRGGHPDYNVEYAWDGESQLAKLTVTQTQAESGNGNHLSRGLFDLRVPIAFSYCDGTSSKTLTIRIHEAEQSFYFPLDRKPDYVSFDVGNHTLKTVTLDYPLPELKAQLQSDPDPLSRICAAEAIAKKGGLEAVRALGDRLSKESFWGVRLEVVCNLAKIKLDQALEGVLAALSDEHPRVRRAAVEALADIKTAASYEAVQTIAQGGDASYYVEAAALKSLGSITTALSAQESTTIALLDDCLKHRQGWNEVVRSGAIAALSQMKTSEAALNVILQYTVLGVPQALRLASIRALGGISPGQSPANLQRILDRLNEISHETFFLTQVAVAASLGQMETPKAIGILQALADQTPDGRVRRIAEEEIQRVQGQMGTDKTLKQLREELDEIKKENQALKSRLENLEAKAQR